MTDIAEFNQCLEEGMSKWRSGDFDKAIIHFRRCIAINPANAAGFEGIGIAAAGKRDYDTMIVYCAKAVALKPDDWYYQTNLAIAYHTKRLWSLAYHHAVMALDINPKQARCLRVAGDVAYRLGDKKAAEVFFLRSIEIDPNNGAALIYIARYQLKRGHIRAHFASLARIIKERERLSFSV